MKFFEKVFAMTDMKSRPFAYADVFRHPPLPEAAFVGGHIKDTIDPAIASVCKNESNCTVFLSDGTWVTTWGQGSHEGHPDQRILCATIHDFCGTPECARYLEARAVRKNEAVKKLESTS